MKQQKKEEKAMHNFSVGKMKAPTLVIHSDDSALPQGARKFFDNLQGPKALYWTSGAHFDFYDQEAHVDEAVSHAAVHFDMCLRPH
jgi:fermentation-respiration switch protein FrsA (DUF1100 family)